MASFFANPPSPPQAPRTSVTVLTPIPSVQPPVSPLCGDLHEDSTSDLFIHRVHNRYLINPCYMNERMNIEIQEITKLDFLLTKQPSVDLPLSYSANGNNNNKNDTVRGSIPSILHI